MSIEKANVSVKIDADVKEVASVLLRRMGMDMTTAIDMFFRQVIAEQRLPFQPALQPSLDEQILAAALAKNPRRVALDADQDGNLIVDAEKHPDIYNWAVEG
ncbi:MAG: type II toxin-antitoxin system RelB/DinJ family antitoxin [Oscillospiraceae bacterium]|jgi:DNA-damage-inducible protein J|nr:type II toxin-antitoxin system RelB/DinJ family antitoxin [Oscillospiraceae bacterium]